jgi:hypothetical protein
LPATCAAALEKLLQSEGVQPDLWRRFFKQAAKVVSIPWQMAVGEDFRWLETEGPKPPGTDLINRYVGRLYQMMADDIVVYNQFIHVMHLLRPPTSLFAPRILWRALWWRKGRETAAPSLPAADQATTPSVETGG